MTQPTSSTASTPWCSRRRSFSILCGMGGLGFGFAVDESVERRSFSKCFLGFEKRKSMPNRIESLRERNFRLGIANTIPRFPNTKETLCNLQAMPMAKLLIHYLNWVMRYVPPRPRKVHIESAAYNDRRWKSLRPNIEFFLNKVRKGEDLTPHLSINPHTRGYTPENSSADRWSDKDFLLNVMGYHHFHLGLTLEAKGFVARTNEVLFAKITRDSFVVVAILNHKTFEIPNSAAVPMSDDRKRLWDIFDEHSSRGAPPRSMYIPAIIALSGHPFHIVKMAQDYAFIVRTIDPKLEDQSYIKEMFDSSSVQYPKSPKMKWQMNYMDIGVLETTSKNLFVFKYGTL
jgi:hypothetical protein